MSHVGHFQILSQLWSKTGIFLHACGREKKICMGVAWNKAVKYYCLVPERRGAGDVRLIPQASLTLIAFHGEFLNHQSHCRKQVKTQEILGYFIARCHNTAVFWHTH